MTDLGVANVGAWVTPSLTVSEHSGSTVASLSITDPDGTVTAGTGEATADTGATWTADPVQITAPGTWLLTWTIIGTGKGVEPQRILGIAAPTPGPAPDPPPLADVTDLVETLGRELTAAEAAKAPRLLASASAKIRAYCKRTFTAVEDAELVLRPVGTELRLPNRPVTEVAQVEQIGTTGSVDRVMSVAEWAFDGIDRIELWPCPTAVSGVLPTATYANTFRVTYSHGESTADQFIVDKTVDMVLRTLLAPTQVAGLVQERIGQYSYQYGQASGDQSPGASVRMTRDDERELRMAGYRRSAGTIQTRAA